MIYVRVGMLLIVWREGQFHVFNLNNHRGEYHAEER